MDYFENQKPNKRNGSGVIFDGLTFNTSKHFAHFSFFLSLTEGSEKYCATCKISTCIMCHKVNIGIQDESEKTKSVFSLDAIVRFPRTFNNKLTSEGR